MQHRASGFTFIEILVVMGIVVVLMGMVAVVVPLAQERQRITQSVSNVKQLATILSERSIRKRWPALSGKAFVLSVVTDGVVDPHEKKNVELFFSPGDAIYTPEAVDEARYLALTRAALRGGVDIRDLTSYAGRRNHPSDRPYVLTPEKLRRRVPIICDDDDGPCHHTDGLVMAYSDASARLVEWAELGMAKPAEPDDPEPFLGDAATDRSGTLAGLSSE